MATKEAWVGFCFVPGHRSFLCHLSVFVGLRIQFKSFRQKENLNNSNLFLIQMQEVMTHPLLIQKWISRFTNREHCNSPFSVANLWQLVNRSRHLDFAKLKIIAANLAFQQNYLHLKTSNRFYNFRPKSKQFAADRE